MKQRLINANKLRKDFLDLPNCYNGFSDTYDKALIIDIVDEQPAVDAVEVVRCKYCKYYDYEHPYPVCNYHEDNVKETDFCCWGERK